MRAAPALGYTQGDLSSTLEYAYADWCCGRLADMLGKKLSEEPWRVSEWTRRICAAAYGEGPFGLCGNEDAGQMSAWYVLASIGIHPLCPGDGKWYLSAPLFSEVKLHAGGQPFLIRAHDAADEHRWIQSVKLNGVRLDRRWITTAEIVAGGVLEFALSNVSGDVGGSLSAR